MRFVQPKSAEQQAAATVFRTRDLLVRQRSKMINALHSHLAEFGMAAPKGSENLPKLIGYVMDPGSTLLPGARSVLKVLAEALQLLNEKVAVLDKEIKARAKSTALAKRLMTIPGVGAILATAIVAQAPAPETFRRGRDFAAWLGLDPLQHSSGGKEKLGRTPKMGDRNLRRLLILGASFAARAAAATGVADGWLARMLTRKPRMLVVVVLVPTPAILRGKLLQPGSVRGSIHRSIVRATARRRQDRTLTFRQKQDLRGVVRTSARGQAAEGENRP